MIDQRIIDAFRETQVCDASSIPQAPSEPSDPWSAPLSFRDFLRLKKEVLEAFNEWRSKQAIVDLMRTVIAMEPEPWPESLQGLTREDIEVLKL